jgi:hypothetical protein
MDEPPTIPRPRGRLYAVVTLVLAVLLLPAAFPTKARRIEEHGAGYDLHRVYE